MDLSNLFYSFEKRFDTDRIELAAGMFVQVILGIGGRPGGLVGSRRDQGVIDIGHRNDSSHQRNVLAGNAIRVSTAVKAFVMIQGDDRAGLYVARLAIGKYRVTDARMF